MAQKTVTKPATKKKKKKTTSDEGKINFLDSIVLRPGQIEDIDVIVVPDGKRARLNISMTVEFYQRPSVNPLPNLVMKAAENIAKSPERTRIRFSAFPNPDGPTLEIVIPIDADKIDHDLKTT